MRGLTPTGHPAGGGHGRSRDRAAPVGAQASLTPGPSKGSCHTALKMATHRGPWGPGREVSQDAWSTSPEPHAAQASLCRDDASRPQGNHRPQRRCVSIQTCKCGSAATSCKQRGPDRPVHRTPGSLPASPGWLAAAPHPTWPSPGRLGPCCPRLGDTSGHEEGIRARGLSSPWGTWFCPLVPNSGAVGWGCWAGRLCFLPCETSPLGL